MLQSKWGICAVYRLDARLEILFLIEENKCVENIPGLAVG